MGKANVLNSIAAGLLTAMLVLLLASSWNDAAIFDETAHIGAGYTYLRYQDARLNPEHPPLIKDLAAFPLLFLRLNFPVREEPFWNAENVHDRQWAAGNALLYNFKNDADQILFWARLPIMLLAVLFGWLLYRWIRSLYGGTAALLALFFYALSPTILAHSRFVTTDIAAAFGFFIGIAAFLRFLEKPTGKRLLMAGVAFGIAQLLKFSLFLLAPIYILLALLWAFLQARENPQYEGRARLNFLKTFELLAVKMAAIGLIGLAIIWSVYAWHVWNYPHEQQVADASFVLKNFAVRPLAEFDLALIKNEYLRPLGQYVLGLLMVLQRAGGGNTTYYLGEVSANGWPSYFPFAYLVKETAAFHILTILALFAAVGRILRAKEKGFGRALDWMRDNFALTASMMFIALYWTYSVSSTLNIGVRHVLPTFPFIYLLVSRELALWMQEPGKIVRIAIVSALSLWLVISVLASFPFFLSYYNELIGTENGYKYIVDSNYDWGQDLKRLRDIAKNDPAFAGQKIHLDYFGGGSPRYYLGDQFEPWWSARGAPPSGSWFAVSASTLMGAWGAHDPELTQKPEDRYEWLYGLEPLRRAGTSIFIYRMP